MTTLECVLNILYFNIIILVLLLFLAYIKSTCSPEIFLNVCLTIFFMLNDKPSTERKFKAGMIYLTLK